MRITLLIHTSISEDPRSNLYFQNKRVVIHDFVAAENNLEIEYNFIWLELTVQDMLSNSRNSKIFN